MNKEKETKSKQRPERPKFFYKTGFWGTATSSTIGQDAKVIKEKHVGSGKATTITEYQDMPALSLPPDPH